MIFFTVDLKGLEEISKCDLDDYLDWQQRLENQKESGLSIDDFCLQEGISKSTYYRWGDRLRAGIPESIAGEHVDREKINKAGKTPSDYAKSNAIKSMVVKCTKNH